MTEQKNEPKKLTEKQQKIAEAKALHDEYLEDGGSLDYISNMGCRVHALRLLTVIGKPEFEPLLTKLTQHRKQVGLEPLKFFDMIFAGTLVKSAEESDEQIADQIIENKAQAEREAVKKKRANQLGGLA